MSETAVPHYPHFDFGWGGCAEELFHYTSRYYAYTEAFLRNLADDRVFRMAGYQAEQLPSPERRLMAAILSVVPGQQAGRDVIQLVNRVRAGESTDEPELLLRYQEPLSRLPLGATLLYDPTAHEHLLPEDTAPLDPFLAIAERLQLPVAIQGRHVEVSLRLLAEHMDAPQAQMRENLHEAVCWLHDAGYRLRNHPGLTHQEAQEIAPDQSV